MADNLNATIVASIRENLARRGIQQKDAAPILGMSQAALSDRMRGRTPWNVPDLERIAELLEVPVAELLQPRAAA